MNYSKHYSLLITRATNRVLETYTERHHIIPLCVNGPDVSENIVSLTPEEHYVAHQLLVKIYPTESKLIYAAKMMSLSNNGLRPNNRLYGWLRRRFINTLKESRGTPGSFKKGRIPWNKGISRTKESIRKQSESMKGKPSPRKGVTLDIKTKQKISSSLKGKVAWNKGITRTEEQKRAHSKSMKRVWAMRKQQEIL